MIGLNVNLNRIFRRDGRTLIVAMDHGVVFGAMPGLIKPCETIEKVLNGGADAIMTTLGVIKSCCKTFDRLGIIWSVPPNPELVEQAVKMGVNAVKLTYFISVEEKSKLETILPVASACNSWGIPLLVEVVPVKDGKPIDDLESVKLLVRIAVEHGAHFIKTIYAEPFKEVVEVAGVPVVILGGKPRDLRGVFEMVKESIEAGGSGVAFGRNIWQSENPEAVTKALSRLIHEDISVEEALKIAKG